MKLTSTVNEHAGKLEAITLMETASHDCNDLEQFDQLEKFSKRSPI